MLQEIPFAERVEDLLEESSPSVLAEANFNTEQWAQVADELGVAGAGTPEFAYSSKVARAKEYLGEFDPTGTKNKYATWIYKHLRNGWKLFRAEPLAAEVTVTEFPEYVRGLLTAYVKMGKQRKLKGRQTNLDNLSFGELINLVTEEQEAIDPIPLLENRGAVVLHEDDRWVVVEVPKAEYADEIGREKPPDVDQPGADLTKDAPWCTRFAENFETYTYAGQSLIFILSKHDNNIVRPRKKSFYPGLDWVAAIGTRGSGDEDQDGAIEEATIEWQDANNDGVDLYWLKRNNARDLMRVLGGYGYTVRELQDYLAPSLQIAERREVGQKAWDAKYRKQVVAITKDIVAKAKSGEIWSGLPDTIRDATINLYDAWTAVGSESMPPFLWGLVFNSIYQDGHLWTFDYDWNDNEWKGTLDVDRLHSQLIDEETAVNLAYRYVPDLYKLYQRDLGDQGQLFMNNPEATPDFEQNETGMVNFWNTASEEWELGSIVQAKDWTDDYGIVQTKFTDPDSIAVVPRRHITKVGPYVHGRQFFAPRPMFHFESLVAEAMDEKSRVEQEVMKRLQQWPKYNPEIWYNPEARRIFVSPGDWEAPGGPNEEDPGESSYPAWESVEQRLLGIEGVDQVLVEPESAPGQSDGAGDWIKLEWKSQEPIVDLSFNPDPIDSSRGLDGPHSDSAYWGASAQLTKFESMVGNLTEANLQAHEWERYADALNVDVQYLQRMVTIYDPTGDRLKYSSWIVPKMVAEGNTLFAPNWLVRVLLAYDDLKRRNVLKPDEKQIERFDMEQLRQLVNSYKDAGTMSNSQVGDSVGRMKAQGVSVVAQQGPWVVVEIPSAEVAENFLVNSGWCIKDSVWFNYYKAKGPVYVVLSAHKTQPNKLSPYDLSYAMAISSRKSGVSELRDAIDVWVDNDWFSKNDQDGQLRQLLTPITNETSFNILQGPHVGHESIEGAAQVYFEYVAAALNRFSGDANSLERVWVAAGLDPAEYTDLRDVLMVMAPHERAILAVRIARRLGLNLTGRVAPMTMHGFAISTADHDPGDIANAVLPKDINMVIMSPEQVLEDQGWLLDQIDRVWLELNTGEAAPQEEPPPDGYINPALGPLVGESFESVVSEVQKRDDSQMSLFDPTMGFGPSIRDVQAHRLIQRADAESDLGPVSYWKTLSIEAKHSLRDQFPSSDYLRRTQTDESVTEAAGLSYLDIGHQGGGQAWFLPVGAEDLVVGEVGIPHHEIDGYNGRYDAAGRIDHDRKLVSVASNTIGKEKYVAALLRMDYPDYQIVGLRESAESFESMVEMAQGEIFQFGPRAWNIEIADQIASGREPEMIDVTPMFSMAGWVSDAEHHGDPDLSKPIYLAPFKGAHIPIDGWHRIRKAKDGGITELPAIVFTDEDAQQIDITEIDVAEALVEFDDRVVDVQNSTAERLVHDQRWKQGNYFRKRMENAGDILREFAKVGGPPAWDYISEKIQSIQFMLDDPIKFSAHEEAMSPENQGVLDELRQAYVDMFMKGDLELTEEQDDAVQLAIVLADGEWENAQILLDRIKAYQERMPALRQAWYDRVHGPEKAFESMVEAEHAVFLSVYRQKEAGLDLVRIFWPSREIWHYYVPTGIFDTVQHWKDKDKAAEVIKAKAVKAYMEEEPDFNTASFESMAEAFEEGQPTTFRFIHNKEKAPDMGTRFNQHLEPAGLYVITVDESTEAYLAREAPDRYDFGTASIQNPIVVTSGIDWKKDLADRYGVVGDELSKALLGTGIDAIVTQDEYGTMEIVLLNPKQQVSKSMPKFESMVEAHWTDVWPRAFQEFRKKYLKFTRQGLGWDLYVQFSDHFGDTLQKKPYGDPTHSDPVGMYAYPLRYVLSHPADVWYGSKANYLRVLRSKTKANILDLQDLRGQDNYAIDLLNRSFPDASFHDIQRWFDVAKKYVRRYVNSSRAVVVPQAFLSVIQYDYDQEPKMDGMRPQWPVRSGAEQTKLLRNAGIDGIEDEAKRTSMAVINDREPEQIVFLNRGAYDVVDVYQLRHGPEKDRGGVGVVNDPEDNFRKLAALTFEAMGDRLAGPIKIDYVLPVTGVNKGQGFISQGGKLLAADAIRPDSYYQDLKIGEKPHRSAKLNSPHNITVGVDTDHGKASYKYDNNDTFEMIADDLGDWYQKQQPVDGWQPWSQESLQQYEKKMNTMRTLNSIAYYGRRWGSRFGGEDYAVENGPYIAGILQQLAQFFNLPYTPPQGDEQYKEHYGIMNTVAGYLDSPGMLRKERGLSARKRFHGSDYEKDRALGISDTLLNASGAWPYPHPTRPDLTQIVDILDAAYRDHRFQGQFSYSAMITANGIKNAFEADKPAQSMIRDLWGEMAQDDAVQEAIAAMVGSSDETGTPQALNVYVDPSWRELGNAKAGRGMGARAWMTPDNKVYLWDYNKALHSTVGQALEAEWDINVLENGIAIYVKADYEAQSAIIEIAPESGGMAEESAKLHVVENPWVKRTFRRGVDVQDLFSGSESLEEARPKPEDWTRVEDELGVWEPGWAHGEKLKQLVQPYDPTEGKLAYASWILKALRNSIWAKDLPSYQASNTYDFNAWLRNNVGEPLTTFDFLKKKKLIKGEKSNINRFGSVEELKDFLKTAAAPRTLIQAYGGEIVHDTGEDIIVKVTDRKAAHHLGGENLGTGEATWCTRSPAKAAEYLQNGDLYFVYTESSEGVRDYSSPFKGLWYKAALGTSSPHSEPEGHMEWQDVNNNPVSAKFLERYPALLAAFSDIFGADPDLRDEWEGYLHMARTGENPFMDEPEEEEDPEPPEIAPEQEWAAQDAFLRDYGFNTFMEAVEGHLANQLWTALKDKKIGYWDFGKHADEGEVKNFIAAVLEDISSHANDLYEIAIDAYPLEWEYEWQPGGEYFTAYVTDTELGELADNIDFPAVLKQYVDADSEDALETFAWENIYQPNFIHQVTQKFDREETPEVLKMWNESPEEIEKPIWNRAMRLPKVNPDHGSYENFLPLYDVEAIVDAVTPELVRRAIDPEYEKATLAGQRGQFNLFQTQPTAPPDVFSQTTVPHFLKQYGSWLSDEARSDSRWYAYWDPNKPLDYVWSNLSPHTQDEVVALAKKIGPDIGAAGRTGPAWEFATGEYVHIDPEISKRPEALSGWIVGNSTRLSEPSMQVVDDENYYQVQIEQTGEVRWVRGSAISKAFEVVPQESFDVLVNRLVN